MANGDAYQDDPTILNNDPLWRRIPDDHWIYDENAVPPRARPSSDAFRDDPDGEPMSVFLGRETANVEEILVDHDNYKVASVSAGFARQLEQAIARDPLDGLPSHAVVGNKRKSGRDKKFAKAAEWVVGPTDAEIQTEIQKRRGG